MKNRFPIVSKTLEGLFDFIDEITRLRDDDLSDFDNLKNVFISGRKVGKVPSSSSDITGDRVGDFNYDASYIYICVDNAGTAAWRRASLGSF